jgi:hypothetical protein
LSLSQFAVVGKAWSTGAPSSNSNYQPLVVEPEDHPAICLLLRARPLARHHDRKPGGRQGTTVSRSIGSDALYLPLIIS